MELTESTELFGALVMGGEMEEQKKGELGSLRIDAVPDMMILVEERFEENVDNHDNWEFEWMTHGLEGSLSCHKCHSHDDVLMRGVNKTGSDVRPTCGQCMVQKNAYSLRDYFVTSIGRLNEIRRGYVHFTREYGDWNNCYSVPGLDMELELTKVQGGKA